MLTFLVLLVVAFLAYSWAGQIIQTKTFLFHYCPTQPKYRQLKTAQIFNVNFKAIWWVFFKSRSDNMLNLINDFRFISVLQWYLKVLRPFEVLLLYQKLLISLIELVNVYRHDRFRNPSSPRRARGALSCVRHNNSAVILRIDSPLLTCIRTLNLRTIHELAIWKYNSPECLWWVLK